MCGIVGYITLDNDTIKHAKDKFFTEALFTDTLRGQDSTGIMSVEQDFRWSYQKQAVPAPDFIYTEGFYQRELETWCSVGHNRAATVGKVTTDNAHPFRQEDILLVHNGTLRATYQLPFKKKGLIVDSEMIAYNLSQVGPEEADEILGKLDGAYALVWFDTRDESVNIVRNSERPLHMGMNEAENALFFSSDGHLMNFVGRRMQNHLTRPSRIWQLGIHRHLKFKKGSLVPEVTTISPFMRTSYRPPTGTTTYPNGRMSTGRSDKRERPGARAAALGKAMINGELRRIPTVHTDMMEWYMMAPDQEYLFEPEKFVPWGNKATGMIYGKIWHEEWETWLNAYICDGTFLSMQNYGTQWTAVPIGIDHTSPNGAEKDELTIIMKLKFYSYLGDMPGKPVEPGKELAVIDYDTDTDMVEGPQGNITVESYQRLVQDGCCMCSGPILIMDADEIIWVGEMANQPMCAPCVTESLRGTSSDSIYTKD